jgi:purine-binding chemotaxis protein CheW
VEILKVREIIGLQPVTRVPRTPAFIKGVINLRGTVIPVLDLRERFGMASAEAALAALGEAERAAAAAVRCTIVVQVAGAHGRAVPLGVAVDRVSEVALVADAEVEDAPSFGAGVRTEYLLGLAKARTADGQGRVRLLLDLDRVLAADEVAELPDEGARAERGAPGRVAAALLAVVALGAVPGAARAQGAQGDAMAGAGAAERLAPAAPAVGPVGFRPGLTEGTGVTPRGRLVVEAGVSVEDAAGGGARTGRAGEVVVHVPVAARAELRLGLPSYAWQAAVGGPTARGMGQGGATLAVRVADGAGRPGWTSPIVAVALGSSVPGGSMTGPDRSWQPVGKLLVEVPASPTVTVLANAGVRRAGGPGARRAEPFATGWVHRRVGARAGAYGETLVARRPAAAGGAQAVAHAGLTYRLTADRHLDAHAGRAVAGGRTPFAGVGLTSRF